jgi:hypothetical protein
MKAGYPLHYLALTLEALDVFQTKKHQNQMQRASADIWRQNQGGLSSPP